MSALSVITAVVCIVARVRSTCLHLPFLRVCGGGKKNPNSHICVTIVCIFAPSETRGTWMVFFFCQIRLFSGGVCLLYD